MGAAELDDNRLDLIQNADYVLGMDVTKHQIKLVLLKNFISIRTVVPNNMLYYTLIMNKISTQGDLPQSKDKKGSDE